MKRIRKYVAIGPESTGKSTLCKILAQHYRTQWCPEYAREFLDSNGNEYSYNDLLTIARGQLALEDEVTRKVAAGTGSSLLFVDTDMYVMRVWCEYVYGDCHRFILEQIGHREYDGYFLCKPDLPWVADALREYPEQHIRDELFLFYRELLTAQKVPWIEIAGSSEERTQSAIKWIDQQIESL